MSQLLYPTGSEILGFICTKRILGDPGAVYRVAVIFVGENLL